jgi:uncharacterized RDD family membrane protein YckC
MYPWDVLGIEATADRKVIKRAYARLLKRTRPQDDPEAFQQLHQAYQVALSWGEYQQEAVGSSTSKPSSVVFNQVEAGPPADDRPAAFRDIHQALHQGILGLAEPGKDRLRRQADSWYFLNQFHDIHDFKYRAELSAELFELVAKLNHGYMVKTGEWLFNGQAMFYLNDMFGWDRDWTTLEARFPNYYLTYTLNILDYGYDRSAQRPAGWLIRILAFLIDGLLSLVLTWVVSRLNQAMSFEALAWVALMIYWLMTLVGECSPKRTSIGKALFYLVITDIKGHQPGTGQVLLRFVLFQLALIPAYAWCLYSEDVLQHVWMYPLIFITLYAALVFGMSRVPMHDDWSGCRVARRIQL